MFTANTKEAAFGRLHKGEAAFGRPPFVVSFVLSVNTGHILVLRRKTCALLRAKTSALLRRKTYAMLSWDMCFVQSQHKGLAQRARHTCMGLEVQRGSRSPAWV